MSTYAELYARCQRRLGRKNFNFATDFLDEMKAAQERLEEGPALPKFLKTEGTETLLAGETNFATLPGSDFIRVYDDAALTYTDTDGNIKQAKRLDTRSQLISKIENGIESGVVYYFIDQVDGSTIIRTHALAADTDFELAFYGKDTVLTGANDNLWTTGRQANLILAIAGQELANWLRDKGALEYFMGLEQRERARMIRGIEADEWGDTSLVMGDPD